MNGADSCCGRMSSYDLGRRGESAACRLLLSKGYEILERNWSCPAGEADIIAIDEGAIVFIEVKTRFGIEKGFPEEAVTPAKRARYEKIAGYYLKDFTGDDFLVRFDVVSLLVSEHDRALVRHIVNAFGGGF